VAAQVSLLGTEDGLEGSSAQAALSLGPFGASVLCSVLLLRPNWPLLSFLLALACTWTALPTASTPACPALHPSHGPAACLSIQASLGQTQLL
jgi:hypothetical protein